jgi:NitT/TauT family transport system ATP-binding protein
MLEARSIAKTYGSGPTAVRAIADISFTVGRSEFLCIVGPSGCGKTTLLRSLAGLLPVSSGEVIFDGKKIDRTPDNMAVVFQDYSRSLFPWMTVYDNVIFPLRRKRHSKARTQELAVNALKAVGLSDAGDRYPWQLSGGMQQRVAIARALAYEPEVLLMDEPFASLDAQSRADLEDLTLRLRQDFGVTIIFVTHDIDEAVYLADRVVALTQRPTSVLEVVDVPLPAPRDQLATKELPAFTKLRSHVYRLIRRQDDDVAAVPAKVPAAAPTA